MAYPIIKVYKESGSIIIDNGISRKEYSSPASVGYSVLNDTFLRSVDTVTLKAFGQAIVTDKPVDSFVDADGVKISPDVELSILLSYFDSLGIAQNSGGGTVDQEVTDSPNAVSGAAVIEYTFSKEEILNLIGGATQLAMPAPTQTAVTANTSTFAWQAIPNATSYDIYKNSVLVTNITDVSYLASGLTASTAYQFGVIAKAVGYVNSDVGVVNITTSQTSPTILILPFNLPQTLTA